MFNYQVDVTGYFIPSPTQKDKNGEPKIFLNTIRKLHLINPDAVLEPPQYQITLIKRGGETKYSIRGLFNPIVPRFYSELTHGKLFPKWKKAENAMPTAEFIKWLTHRVNNPNAVLTELLTTEPIIMNGKSAA